MILNLSLRKTSDISMEPSTPTSSDDPDNLTEHKENSSRNNFVEKMLSKFQCSVRTKLTDVSVIVVGTNIA
jgi:hypothetical protein